MIGRININIKRAVLASRPSGRLPLLAPLVGSRRRSLESNQRVCAPGVSFWFKPAVLGALACLLATPALAQRQPQLRPKLDESCTVNILNRSASVNQFGGFVLPNVPVDRGLYRLRATCQRNGRIERGQSDLLELMPNGETVVPYVDFGREIPIPSSLTLYAEGDETTLVEPEQTTSLVVFADIADGRTHVLNGAQLGTIYVSSNPAVASVDEDGVVTAHTRGRVNIVAVNEGRVAGIDINVDLPDDRDGDGLTDGFELRNGLDPDDPTDAALDLDADGLTNLEEQAIGSNIRIADTDGDGLRDGFETRLGTDPTRADTDGDGLQDGEERQRKTNPTLADTDGDGIPDGIEVEQGLDPRRDDPTTTVTGTVVDPDGIAIEGAVVIVADSYVANTDEAGGFEISNVVAGEGVEAQARYIIQGVVMDAKTDAIEPIIDGTTDLGEIQLRRILNAVGGTIYSPRDVPVPDARVRVIVGEEERTTNADRAGNYVIQHVAEGDLTVIATDAGTGLRGRAFGTLLADEALTVDVRLSASGTLEGQVFGRDGLPLEEGITVTLRGPRQDEVTTDAIGRYRFDFIPLGQYTLEAFDQDGNRGRTSAAITGTNQVVTADISFLGVGQVTGVVESGGGAPIEGAQVRIIGRGPFGGRADVVSGADGRFVAENIFIGRFDVSVVDPDSGLAGAASGRVDFEGDVADVVVTLRAAGAVVGTLFESDGVTPVDGGAVTLDPSGRVEFTGPDGAYRFSAVPLGAYTLVGAAAQGPDRGRAVVNLVEPDADVTADVTLLGLGEVSITVRDADGQLVNGAQVTVSSRTGFEQARSGVVGADGQITFTDVLAGPFAVDALDPLSGLVGRIESSVLPGERVALVVELEGAGSITGRTLAPDGATPIRNVRVVLEPGGRVAQSDALGVFRFDLLPVAGGPYQLQAFDGNGTLRATEVGIALLDHGDVIERDLVLSGTGIARGTVTNPDGSAAGGVAVTVESDVQGAPPQFTTTAGDGTYAIDGVPEGRFTVTASNRPLRRAGSERGTLSFDGEVVVVDVAMAENIIPPAPGANPLLGRLYDANNFQWSIQQDGRTQDGTQSIFRGDAEFNRGAMVLSVRVAGGVEPIPFEGTGGRLELEGRQIVAAGVPLGDIVVTRKAYAPNDGYFVRYLELIRNDSAEAQAVDVRLDSHVRFISRVRDGFTFNQPPRVVLSSDGDAALTLGAGATDRWVIIDDDLDVDPFQETSLPAFAHIFDGVGGERAADSGSFDLDAEATYGQLQTNWQALDIPPGATIAIMHFGVQQVDQAGARAAAERLVQAPAEALVGLTAAERLAIVNFDLEAGDGLDDLPALTGTVDGVVYEGDEETTVRRADVRFKSQHPLFGRTWTVQTGDDGAYDLGSRFGDGANNRAIPLDAFDVWARHPVSRLESTVAQGGFGDDDLATRDIIFSNAGRIAGEVRRSDGNVVSTGIVRLVGDDLRVNAAIAEDGQFVFGGVLPGNYSLTAEVPIPGGTPLAGEAQALVSAGETAEVDITIVPTGGVGGFVRDGGGNIAISVRVDLNTDGFSRRAETDTGGRYSFLDIPVGDYAGSAREPVSRVTSTEDVTVEAFEIAARDIQLISIGQVRVTATYDNGDPAPDAPIQILRQRLGNFYRSAGRTGNDGTLTIEGVPEGNFSVRALNPGNSALTAVQNGMVQVHDETIEIAVVIPVDDPPAVNLVSPVAGDVVEGTTLSLRADAFDDLGIDRVEFLVDGVVIGTDRFAPYIQSWVVPQGDPAALSIVARAFDTGPNSTDSAPVIINRVDDANPPVVAIASPFEGAAFIEGAPVTIVASANDDVGVDRVEYFIDGAPVGVDEIPPYRLEAPLPPDAADDGPRDAILRVVGYDRAGNQASAERTIQVLPDAPPTIELVEAPAPGSRVVEGTPINITADAQDDVGVSVDLRVNGQVVATRNQAPFTFAYIAPAADAVENPFEIVVQARDTQNQTADALVSVSVSVDQPPTIDVTAPLADVDVIEGAVFQVAADVEDDLGVDHVDFLVDGQVVGTRAVAPWQADVRLPAGDAGATPVIVRAYDTANQSADGVVQINRLDDAVPPTASITSPQNGATIVVGASDIYFALSRSNRYEESDVDFDGDGEVDSYAKAQVLAARAMLAQLDPDVARVGVLTTDFTVRELQPLTRQYADVEAVLTAYLDEEANVTEYPDRAVDSAVFRLQGVFAERTAAPVVYVFGTNDGRNINTDAALAGGVLINTVMVGPGFDSGRLSAAAQATGGQYMRVLDAADLQTLADSVLVGAEALRVTVEADDDVAVRRVDARVATADGAIDENNTDTAAPYELIFGLPALIDAAEVTITADVRDFGGNIVAADPVTVTVLPSNQAPQILELAPALGVPGTQVTIRGRYFAPVPNDNTVTFNGVAGFMRSATKSELVVEVPPGATTGDLIVTSDGQASDPARFGIDVDADGLDDEQEAAAGTDPANPDSDDDGLLDGAEAPVGADPLNPDTDGDGLLDGFEVANGFDPTAAGEDALDPDDDGLTTLQEQGLGTDPNDDDSDDDLLIDGDEVAAGTDALDPDSDDGGTLDGYEVNQDGTDPLDPGDDVPRVNLATSLRDANNFLWDVQRDGNISNGSSDAYDGGLRLRVDNTFFASFDVAIVEDAGRELVIGPMVVNALRVRRKIFVPEDDRFARFLEIFENPTAAPIQVTVLLDTNLGSDGSTELVEEASGDGLFGPEDDWLITDDADASRDPSMAHVVSGPNAAVEPSAAVWSRDNIDVTYTFEVPAGETAIVMHFAAQNSNRADAGAQARTLRALGGSALRGLSPDEQVQIINFVAFVDSDLDGLPDAQEGVAGTDPNNPDTDGDGMNDGFEVAAGLDPLVDDAAGDLDGDGLTNGDEHARGTDPNAVDSDGDGLEDGFEVNTSGTDPALADTDGDGINDFDEVNGVTDPLDADSDDDGLNDGDEIAARTDPNNPDSDGDGARDGWEEQYNFNPLNDDQAPDFDGDGLFNAGESDANTNPFDSDTDNDGLTDGDEVLRFNSDPTLEDTDGGGRLDGPEVLLDGTDANDPADDLGTIELRANLRDGADFLWDVNSSGTMSNGSNDAFDTAYYLEVDGRRFFGPSVAGLRLDDRELVLGPVAMEGLYVARQVYIPADDTFARYRERFINPTNAPIEIEVEINGAMGSDANTVLVGSSHADEAVVDVDDDWFVTDDNSPDGGDPVIFHLFSDRRGAVQPDVVQLTDDDILYRWTVTVPANGEAIVMHYSAQHANRPDALANAARIAGLQGRALFGMTRADQNAVVNWVAYLDADEDGLPDEDELVQGTDPGNPDTDNDGLLDGFEVDNGFDPLTGGDGPADPDLDNRTNLQEQADGTDPNNADTDGDGLNDGGEVDAGSDPFLPDTDGDGLTDGDEVNVHLTDPTLADTDGGGAPDGFEVQEGTDPLNPGDDPELPNLIVIDQFFEFAELQGSLDIDDPQWGRPDEECGLQAELPNYHYDTFEMRNDTDEFIVVEVRGVWPGDGFLHVFDAPFDPENFLQCRYGNDDEEGIETSFVPVFMGPGETVTLVVSTFDEADPMGAYTLEVTAQGEPILE